jgi:hypothetical protein
MNAPASGKYAARTPFGALSTGARAVVDAASAEPPVEHLQSGARGQPLIEPRVCGLKDGDERASGLGGQHHRRQRRGGFIAVTDIAEVRGALKGHVALCDPSPTQEGCGLGFHLGKGALTCARSRSSRRVTCERTRSNAGGAPNSPTAEVTPAARGRIIRVSLSFLATS